MQRDRIFPWSMLRSLGLSTGNTLITESDKGEVFEVTPRGDEVWRFVNPDETEEGLRAGIWRMTRFDPAELHFLR